MRKTIGIFAALSLAIGAPAAFAQEKQQTKAMSCMAGGYSADQRETLDGILPVLAEDMGASGAGSSLAAMINEVVGDCASKLGWSEEKSLYAMLYEFARLTEDGFRTYGPLSSEDIAKIDESLAEGDRSRLWEVLERQVLAGMSRNVTEPDPSDSIIMGAFIIGTGIEATDENAERVGTLLGMMAMQRFSAREFAAL